MSKTGTYALKAEVMCLLTSFMAASCSLNSVSRYDEPCDIVFNPKVFLNTKAEAGATDYPADGTFAIWAYSLPEEQYWASGMDGAALKMDGEEVRHGEDGLWRPEVTRQWEGGSDKWSFFALSPYGRGDYSHTEGITFEDYTLEEAKDLMYVDGVTDMEKHGTSGIITLPFKRALAKIMFKGHTALPDETYVLVKKIYLSEAFTGGDFHSRPVPAWTPEGEPGEVILFEGAAEINGEIIPLTADRYVLPQSGSIRLNLKCEIKVGTEMHDDFLTTLIPVKWNAGKYYSYTLKVTMDQSRTLELHAEKDGQYE